MDSKDLKNATQERAQILLEALENGKKSKGASAEISGQSPPDGSTAVPTCQTQDAALPLSTLWKIYNENEVGDAKLYNELARGSLVFVKYWERFLIWKENYWQEDHYNEACQKIEDVVTQYQRLYLDLATQTVGAAKEEKAAIEAKQEQVLRRIKRLRSKVGQDHLLSLASRVENQLTILPEQLDAHPYKLACPNGVYNFKTGEFSGGAQGDYLMNHVQTPLDLSLLEAENPCPKTQAFLMSSHGDDPEIVNFIWRLLGYGLIRDRKEHVFVVFWGPHGRNGKDTLMKIVSQCLGPSLSGDVPVEMILQTNQPRNSSAPSPDVLALKGMCIAWINEAEDGQKFAMAKIKKMTGGGYLTARGLMDKKPTTFLQTHLSIMTTNELPRAKADDAAFWYRTLLVKWPFSFVPAGRVKNPEYERPANPNIEDELREEMPGILARMIRGANEYLRNISAGGEGLAVPEKIHAWTAAERDRLDDLAEFLEECCIIEERRDLLSEYQTRISARDLNDAWTIWYSENRDKKKIPGAKTLGLMLDKREFPKKKSSGIWRLGIELKWEWAQRVAEEQARSARNTPTHSQEEF